MPPGHSGCLCRVLPLPPSPVESGGGELSQVLWIFHSNGKQLWHLCKVFQRLSGLPLKKKKKNRERKKNHLKDRDHVQFILLAITEYNINPTSGQFLGSFKRSPPSQTKNTNAPKLTVNLFEMNKRKRNKRGGP